MVGSFAQVMFLMKVANKPAQVRRISGKLDQSNGGEER